MIDPILDQYKKYLAVTDDPAAAASLVLAAAYSPTQGEEPELLSVAEAAEALGVSQTTVYKVCADGDLKHIKVGRQIRIRRLDLDRISQPAARSKYW